MAKKVSADTISALTAASCFSGTSPGTPPSPQKMIDDIRAALKKRAVALSQSAEAAKLAETDPDAPPSPFEISSKKALQNIATFEKIVNNVPQGFRLVPVLYSKIDRDHNAHVYSEFGKEVRRPFLQYCATHHAKELAALGICAEGIEQMKMGFDPVDENGSFYAVNIDHIVERSGGGQMSKKRGPDPLMPAGSRSNFLVNHFDNLILIPEQVHEIKNILNDLQQAASTRNKSSAWVLMLVPEVDAAHSGFVAQPQDPSHYLYGLMRRKEDPSRLVNQASFSLANLLVTIDSMHLDKDIHHAIVAAENYAAHYGRSVHEQMEYEDRPDKAHKQHRLTQTFNAAVARKPAQKALVEKTLRPKLLELDGKLKAAFTAAFLSAPANDNGLRGFMPFYQGKKLTSLRQSTAQLPIPEAVQLHDTFAMIDAKIRQRNQGMKP